jgi:hypothetical protein
MKKELKEGMGFICANLEEKKRIWQKLTDAGYEMCDKIGEDELKRWKHIFWSTGFDEWHMTNSLSHITDPLNESDFFDEWTPKAGEWVEVRDNGNVWSKRQYLCTIDGKHLTVADGQSFQNYDVLMCWKHIRPKPETMTLQEVREALGKPNLIVTQ